MSWSVKNEFSSAKNGINYASQGQNECIFWQIKITSLTYNTNWVSTRCHWMVPDQRYILMIRRLAMLILRSDLVDNLLRYNYIYSMVPLNGIDEPSINKWSWVQLFPFWATSILPIFLQVPLSPVNICYIFGDPLHPKRIPYCLNAP